MGVGYRSGKDDRYDDESSPAQKEGYCFMSSNDPKVISTSSPDQRAERLLEVATPQQAPPPVDLISYPLADRGNASPPIAMHGDGLRYSLPQKIWLIWSGEYWHTDAPNQI